MKVFCDLDGTLIDIAHRHYRVYSEVTREFGGVPLDQPTYWDLKRKKTIWAELLLLSNLREEVGPEYLGRFIQKIEEPEYLRQDELFPGSLAALELLKNRSDECYLVTLRRRPGPLKQQLEALDLGSYFTDILSGHSESDGHDVKIALVRDKLRNSRAVIIGDSEADIVTGKTLGMTTIAVTSGIRDERFLRALEPRCLLKTIGELSADEIVA